MKLLFALLILGLLAVSSPQSAHNCGTLYTDHCGGG